MVLLAREGAARDRLRAALNDAGAQLVLEADPTRLAPADLSAAAPQVVVVALDPVTEDALERFEDVLIDPSIEVLFEEAELAAVREGWDAARWIRHISAKLHGHSDVLPPGREPEPEQELFAPDADRPYVPPVREEAYTGFDPVAAEIPSGGLSFVANDHVAELPPAPAAIELENDYDGPAAELTPFESTFDVDAPAQAHAEEAPIELAPFESSFDDEFEPAAAAEPRVFEAPAFEAEFDAPEFETTAPVEPAAVAPKADPAPVMMYETKFEFVSERAPPPLPPEPAADKAPPAAPDWGFADDAPAASAARADGNGLRHDLDAIEQRISGLELVQDRPAHAAGGAVLVLAGIGGPDAVRQLLGAMPEDFPRPVLVQQRLDGGRYDKLVAQMQRATSILVKLAEPGSRAIAGVIYILPAGVGVTVGDSGIQFNGDGNDVLAALPPGDSAVLMLSGSDPALVDAAMNHSWAGALVAGQAPDGCFDAAAPNALIARGGESGQPADLAARLAARWS
ncbi:chemotaxis protein [Lysobacter silvisoli]|uniref:Chemotaxis protein n=1 Tax=Lysobacter silvisoli TaxID=2293254 RepID=A0A371JZ34_9GAMM|nr:chemotaxis protein [Lysobacter silvisoli]